MSWDAIAPTEPEEKPWEYSDLPKAAVSGGAQTVYGLAGLAKNYIADTEKGKEVLRQIQLASGNAQEAAEGSMTPQGRALLGANLTSEEFLSHPVASVVLKTMSMTPSLAASALPGGVIGAAAGRIAGLAATAAASGALGAGDIEQTIESEINKASDKDLKAQSSLYAGYRLDMSERDAKEELTKQMMGWKPAVGFLLGVGTGMLGPEANIVRGVSKDAVRHGIKAAAIEGAASETAEETYGAYAGQKAEVERGARKAVDLSEVIAQGLTGGLMGGIIGGASGIGGGHKKGEADVETETTGRGAEEPAVQAPAQAAAPGEPVSVATAAAKAKSKKASEKGVEVVQPLEPDAAQKAGITDLAQPTKPTLAQAAETATPDVPSPATAQAPQPPAPDVAQPQQAPPTPPAEPAAAPPPEGAPAPMPQQPAPVPGVPTGETSEVTPQVTQPPAAPVQQPAAPTPEPPAPSQPAAPVAQEPAPVAQEPPIPTAPTEPVKPTGRVFTQTTPEVRAAQEKEAKRAKSAAEKAARPEGAPAPSKKGSVADKAKADRAAHAERIFGEDHKPLTMPETKEARSALADTLQLTLDKAAGHGLVLRETLPADVRKKQVGEAYHLSIPQQVGDKNMSPHVRYLRELHDIIKTLRSGEGWRNKKDGSEGDSVGRVRDFIDNHNIKDLEGIAVRRKEWGEKLNRRHQGDAGELAEGGAAPKGKVKTVGSEGKEATTRVLSPEEKAKLAAEIEAKVNKPITTPAEVKAKAAALLPPITTPAEVKAKAAAAKAEVAPPKVDYSKPAITEGQVARYAAKHDISPKKARAILEAEAEKPAAPTMTVEMMQDLTTMGYSHADIRGMTPERATEIIDEGIVKPKAEVPEEAEHADETEQERINREKVAEIERKEQEKTAFINAKKERPKETQAASAEDIAAYAPKAAAAPVTVKRRPLIKPKKVTSESSELLTPIRNPDTGEEATPLRTLNAREALKELDFRHLKGVSEHIAPWMKTTLMRLVGDTPVHVFKDADYDRAIGTRTRGTYTTLGSGGKEVTRYISIRESEMADPTASAHSLIHELSHDFVNRAIMDPKNTKLVTDIRSMVREVVTYLNEHGTPAEKAAADYAVSVNEREFMTEAFSKPAFQELLSKVPVSDKLAKSLGLTEEKPSVWDAVLKAVRGVIEKAIGLKLPGNPRMIEAIMRLGSELEVDRAARGVRPPMSPQQMLASVRASHAAEGIVTKADKERQAQEMAKRSGISVADAKYILSKYADIPPRGQASTATLLPAPHLSKLESSNLTTDEVLDRAARGYSDAKINLSGGLSRIKTKLSTFHQLAQSYAHLFGGGDKDSLTNRLFNARAMQEHEKSKVLAEHHAETVVGNLAKADREHPELSQKLKDVIYEAARGDINLEGDNGHLGKDKMMGVQAKSKVDRLQQAWNDPKFNPIRKAYSDAFKFFRELHNTTSREAIRDMLAKANIRDEALADRIHREGLNETDEATLDSNLVKMLNQVQSLKRKQGSFIPFRRYGNYISAGEHELTVPANGIAVGEKGNTIQFVDPRPKNGTDYGDARARAQAKIYLRQTSHTPQGNQLDPLQVRKVYVDRNNQTELVEPEDPNAIPAYRVSMQTEHVEMHETEAEARNNEDVLKEAGLVKTRTHRRDEAFQNARGNMQSAMGAVLRSLENQQRYKDASETERAAMRETFHDLTLAMSGPTSIKNSMRHRKNVAGMSRDIARVAAEYGRMTSNHIAMLRHRDTIDRTLGEMRDFMKAHSDKDNIRREEIYQEFVDRLYGRAGRAAEEHKPGFTTRVLQLTRLARLAGPSFHIINAHEPWTTSLPVIGGRHGFVKTARKLVEVYNMIGGRAGVMQSFRDMAAAYTNDNGFTNYPKLFKEAIRKNQFMSEAKKQRLMDAIDYMDARNLYGNSSMFEMGKFADPTSNAALRAVDRIDLMANQVGSAIEAINRTVTGLTAYELEHQKNGGNHEAAQHYAYSTAHDTMGDYSSWNAAPVFNTQFGRMALQFKKFGQKTYNLLGNTMAGALRGDRGAMKQFAGLMVTHGMVAGVLGLPLEPFKVALMAANMLGVTGFTPDDYEYAVRQLAARVAGQKGGEIISKGLYRGIGVDVSSRFSLGDLLTHGAPKSNKDADIKSWLFDTMAGAPAGYLLDQVKAAQLMMKGDVAGALEKASPIRSVGDIAKAATGLAGPKKSAAGTTQQEQLTPYQAFLRGIGFQPSASSELSAIRGVVARESGRASQERSAIMKAWGSSSGGDKVKAQRAVQDWNARHEPDEQISQKDLMNAAKRIVRQAAAEQHGVVVSKRNKSVYERAASTFNP